MNNWTVREKVDYIFINTGIEYQATKNHIKELEEKYAAAQAQLDSGSSQYLAAVNEYNSKITIVADKRAEHTAKTTEYNNNKAKADSAKDQLDTANNELLAAKLKIETTEALINSTQSTLDSIKNNQNVSQEDLDLDLMAERLEETNPELAKILFSASNLTAQGMAADVVVETEALLEQYNTELVVAEETYQKSKAEYDEKYAEWYDADQQLKAAKTQLDNADAQLKLAETQLSQFKDQIQSSGFDLQFGSLKAQTEYNNAQTQLTQQTMLLQNIHLMSQIKLRYRKKSVKNGLRDRTGAYISLWQTEEMAIFYRDGGKQ